MVFTKSSAFVLLILVLLSHVARCTHFIIAPLEKDCLHFRVEKNNVVVGSYEIIDKKASCSIYIVNRNDKKKEKIFKSENVQDKFEIKVAKPGIYSFCYANQKNVEITIMFTLRVKESHDISDEELGTVDDVKKINSHASQLHEQFFEVFEEQEKMMETTDLYKQFNEKMNSKLILWSEVQIVLLIILTIIHIYYIKSFFEIKTIV
ncbi:cop-coated vesicle membrane protein p24 precursor [Plasmodium gonderi]|uniref:Cop-coated vesicle membrane protein p24 n=1 Tax=Plasmodium gonderi TaxID=77519 RepID=A0A1Y1JRA2_PLAGO|nr:cop-coated vesicle membrane protein p24 precursor [Plasmodium gonderi]GAW83352.1 cop-coated vesicle membrane protein p24 precursor [Plasmodium gonderi]